jgi:hypothetical protein
MAGLGFKPGATPKSSTTRPKRRKLKSRRVRRKEERERDRAAKVNFHRKAG